MLPGYNNKQFVKRVVYKGRGILLLQLKNTYVYKHRLLGDDTMSRAKGLPFFSGGVYDPESGLPRRLAGREPRTESPPRTPNS